MSMPFQITKFPNVDVQLRTLAKRAAEKGIYQAFSSAVARVNEHLKTRPLEWGDPSYNTKHPGGIVCHGMEMSLMVHFAVYEAEQVVCILDIEPMSNSLLAEHE